MWKYNQCLIQQKSVHVRFLKDDHRAETFDNMFPIRILVVFAGLASFSKGEILHNLSQFCNIN